MAYLFGWCFLVLGVVFSLSFLFENRKIRKFQKDGLPCTGHVLEIAVRQIKTGMQLSKKVVYEAQVSYRAGELELTARLPVTAAESQTLPDTDVDLLYLRENPGLPIFGDLCRYRKDARGMLITGLILLALGAVLVVSFPF